MKYISLFSGIEAATVAFEPLGWTPVAFAEIEPFPCTVLAHYYPDVPNVGDVTKFDWTKYANQVDVVVGGPPCQAFSVAGLRNSLEDTRGNLSLEYVRAVNTINPRYVLTENVPGWLSTKDNAFGCFLAAMVGANAPLVPPREHGRWSDAGVVAGPLRSAAWRVLDAQYFGLAQRRRRVFVICCPRNGPNPASILFEQKSVSGNPAPRRETREGTTRNFEVGFRANGVTDIAPTVDTRASNGPMQSQSALTILQPYNAVGVGATASGMRHVETCLSTSQQRIDAETETFIVYENHPADSRVREMGEVASSVTTRYGTGGGNVPFVIKGAAVGRQPQHGPQRGEILGDGSCYTLDATDVHAVAFQQNTRDEVRLMGGDGSIAGSLSAEAGMHQQNYVADVTGTLTGWDNQRQRIHDEQGIAPTFSNNSGGGGNEVFSVKQGMQVRRLTPTECERLQGFKDGYTLVPFRGKPAADGNRYRALGNSFAVPVVHWIGRRIDMVDRLLKEIA